MLLKIWISVPSHLQLTIDVSWHLQFYPRFSISMYLTTICGIGKKGEERFESLYIINYKLYVQDEALYRLCYTNIRKENTQLPYTII